jgi:hypothetical protein
MLVPDLWLNPEGGYLTTYAVEPANGGSFVPVRFHQGQMGMIGASWGLERVGPRFVRQLQKGEFVEATLKVRIAPTRAQPPPHPTRPPSLSHNPRPPEHTLPGPIRPASRSCEPSTQG